MCGIIFFISFLFLLSLPFSSGAGTIKFKDGTILSDATIVSISEDDIWIEKDNTKRKFSLKSIGTYSSTNLSSAMGENLVPGEFMDYKVSILNVKMPKEGEDKDGNTEICEVSYIISKNPGKDSGNAKKIKIPYAYLYVLTSRTSETEERKIYRYCYPDAAKPKGKGYDVAAVMEKVNAFDRREWGDEDYLSTLSNNNNKIGGKVFKFELKKVGTRKILAYHLEVWGNNSMIADRSEILPRIDLNTTEISKKWWERY